jgi:hypothetical protein
MANRASAPRLSRRGGVVLRGMGSVGRAQSHGMFRGGAGGAEAAVAIRYRARDGWITRPPHSRQRIEVGSMPGLMNRTGKDSPMAPAG